jgi:hypothetical protein
VKAVAASFVNQLRDLEEAVRLVDDLRILGSTPPAISLTRTRLGQQALLTQARLRATREWEIVALDGSVLYLSAQFEATARGMAEAFAHRLVRKVSKYSDLPQSLRDRNARQIGQLLEAINSARFAHVDHLVVVNEFARAAVRDRPVSLYAEGFSAHDTNLNSSAISQLYGKFDIQQFWPRVARDPLVRSHFGSTSAPHTNQVLQNKLNAFMQIRNQIAHHGPSYQSTGSTVILDYIQFFRVMVPAMADVLEDYLASYP